MLELERPGDLAQYLGKEIGVSDWFTIDQAIIDKFADATGDHQWIHVDVERAKREVPAGSRIRLRQKIKAVEPVDGGGVRITSENTVEVEGAARPALVAETISMQ